MKKYANRKQGEEKEYEVGNLVLLSTKYLKQQIVERRLEKLTKQFIEPYKVKGIVLINAIELELPSSIKTYPVVNVSQVQLYRPQVKGQRKTLPKPVIVKGKEEFKVEKILNKRVVRGKEIFLV